MYIKVKVSASSKKEQIIKKNKDTYIISVKEKAERNLANHRICHIIASLFKININNVRIINGHQNKNKLLEINFPNNLL